MTERLPHGTSSELSWRQFEIAAADLAARGSELLKHFGFVFLGTIRADGWPRISPVETHIVNGQLMLVMITGTKKVRDVLRDPGSHCRRP